MLSRRTFLQALSSASAAQSLRPFEGVSTEGNVYRNGRVGLQVEKPAGWHFSSIVDFVAVRQRTLLMDEIPGELHALKGGSSLPLFLFEDSRYRQGHFVPGIGLYDEPLEGGAPADQLQAHANMVARLGSSYPECRVLEDPAGVHLAGAEGTHCRWRYTHEIDSGFEIPLYVQSVLVFWVPGSIRTTSWTGFRTGMYRKRCGIDSLHRSRTNDRVKGGRAKAS